MRKAISLDGNVIEQKLMRSHQNKINSFNKKKGIPKKKQDVEAKHWNIAVAWAGEQVLNGRKENGHKCAEECMKYIVEEQAKIKKRTRRQRALRYATPMSKWFTILVYERLQSFQNQKTKPYGAFVFIPMVLTVYPVFFSMLYRIGSRIPAVKAASLWILGRLRPSIEVLAAHLIRLVKTTIERYGLNSAFITRPAMSNTLIRYH